MQTQVVTDELQRLTVDGIVEISGMENNETFLLQVICTNASGACTAFIARVKFEGMEEANLAARVERTQSVVLDATGKQPVFLFLNQTTLVACEVLV